MENVNMLPVQFIVDVEDESLLNDIRRAIKMIKGVGAVHKVAKKSKSSVELALEDMKAGRVHHAESVDDLFNQILNED